VYGIHPVLELLRSRREIALVVVTEEGGRGTLRELVERARRQDVAVEVKPRAEVDALARGGHHQGVVAITGEYVYADVEDILSFAEKRGEAALIVALDGVQDPQNLGAIVRSAHVLGAHGVLVPMHRAVSVTSSVVRVSAGATEHMHIARVTNLVRTLEDLKERGLWVVGTVAEGGRAPWEVDQTSPTVLVLGAEGKGLRPLVLRVCDERVRIPMAGQVSSLNVAAAASITLYEVLRQRLMAQKQKEQQRTS